MGDLFSTELPTPSPVLPQHLVWVVLCLDSEARVAGCLPLGLSSRREHCRRWGKNRVWESNCSENVGYMYLIFFLTSWCGSHVFWVGWPCPPSETDSGRPKPFITTLFHWLEMDRVSLLNPQIQSMTNEDTKTKWNKIKQKTQLESVVTMCRFFYYKYSLNYYYNNYLHGIYIVLGIIIILGIIHLHCIRYYPEMI